MLPIVEIFYSLQGEGRFAGTPSVFIRLGGCNLRCPGFPCDTQKAIDARKYSDIWSNAESADEILTQVDSILSAKTSAKVEHVVITGGEPTLHFSNPIFIDLAKKLLDRGRKITVETNATVDVDFEANPIMKEFVFAMSVKLSNSMEPREKRIRKESIKNLATNTKGSFFKFVIADETLKDEIAEITMIAPELPVYCMPQGATKEELNATCKSVFEFCVKESFSYCDRAHIRVYGKKEGV